jgi:hypothetical protein
MSDSLSEPKSPAPREPLPPVQPPSASFLLQLFLIPLVIVTVIVMVWLLFSWLAHMGSNPQDLVRDIGKVNDASWQRAYNLAELLRKPQYQHLKQDRALAKELAATLTSLRNSRPQRKRSSVDETDAERKLRSDAVYENRIKLEVYLCHVLGEFTVDESLAALIATAGPDASGDPEGMVVRSAALGAIAVQAGHRSTEALRDNAELMQVLLESSRERGSGAYGAEEYDKLRSAAAYALGMVGGEESLGRLAQMLDDADANVRYNAALGLCRHGDARALPVLEEMLDPNSTAGLDDPDAQGNQEILASGQKWKRVQVLTNAIRGARMLVAANPQADYRDLATWLTKIESADVIEKVKLDAKDLRLKIEKS